MMKERIKNLMKEKPWLLNLFAWVHNILRYNNSWKYRRRQTIKFSGAFLRRCRFDISGQNNCIMIGPKARLNNCRFIIIGNGCKIVIGGGSTIISDTEFWCEDENSSITIGEDFTMEGGHIATTEGESIIIGNDCMFSGDIEIRNGDSHSIIDISTQKRINHAKPVTIGDHVWLAAHVRILKGSKIPSNVIIGNSTVVSTSLAAENAIYAGMPAKMVKENIGWDRERLSFNQK